MLTKYISSLDLSFYPQIGMVIFVAVFIALMWKVWRRPSAQVRNWSAIPFDSDTDAPHTDAAPSEVNRG